MENNKLCGMLGLAYKARKIISGTNIVTELIRSSNKNNVPLLVLVASNVSENTLKRITNCCVYHKVEYISIPLTTEELAHTMGKISTISVIGIVDKSFALAIKKIAV